MTILRWQLYASLWITDVRIKRGRCSSRRGGGTTPPPPLTIFFETSFYLKFLFGTDSKIIIEIYSKEQHLKKKCTALFPPPFEIKSISCICEWRLKFNANNVAKKEISLVASNTINCIWNKQSKAEQICNLGHIHV